MCNIKILCLVFCGIYMSSCVATNGKPIQVIAAHAHNDYLHERPLFEALSAKFKSVEADVFSVDGELLVAHEIHEVKPEKTLERYYLEPLQRIIQQNAGSVYGEGSSLVLFVDIKNDGLNTYKLLDDLLKRYAAMLTVFHRSGEVKLGAVTVIVSGERPLAYMQSQNIRYAGYDGRLTDLASELLPTFMPYISDNWTQYFSWTGEDEMPGDEQLKLMQLVEAIHAKGYKLRFWATPDMPGKARENVWTQLKSSGVDLIGTDNIQALKNFLTPQN